MKTAALLLALCLSGCAVHRPAPVVVIAADSAQLAPLRLPTVAAPSILAGLGHLFSSPQARNHRQAVRWLRVARRRPYRLPAVAPDSLPVARAAAQPVDTSPPGFLSGLANIFSTPQGRADRQAVRIARAAVPRSIGKGAVYAVNSKVTNGGNKPTGPVTQADSGSTVSNAAANAQQQTVKGNGNKLAAKQANPTQQAKGWAAALVDNLTGWIPWVIGGALVLAVVFRKRLPIVGPFFS